LPSCWRCRCRALAPSEDAKLKAAEAKVVAAANAKLAGEQLTRGQDQVAGKYIKAQKAKGITVKPTPIAPPAPAATAPAVAAKK
jgi:hypothetical protein